jgi:hypothetical protein
MGKRIIAKISVLVATVFLSGCGSGGQSSSQPATKPVPISGAVAGGAVQGALVFADHLLSGNGTNRGLDASEAAFATVTDANGNFTIPATPAYRYLLVTQGGTDSITFQPAMQMLALAGAMNVSPLTTMAALDPNVQYAIESLGIAYDANLYAHITPAAALLVQSIQTAVVALTQAFNYPDNNKLPVDQLNLIQLYILLHIAPAIEVQSVADLTNPTTLTTTFTTAIKNALQYIASQYGTSTASTAGISINNTDNTLASDIANQAVTSAANAITSSSPGVSLSDTTTSFSETALVNSAGAVIINTAIANAISAAAGKVIVTPPTPPFPTPVISGTPTTEIAVSKTYSFVPKASDSKGNLLVFSIVNKPAWATFNPGTGALTGTPTNGDVLTTTGIVITASNGIMSASLPAFSIKVYVPSGSPGGTGTF